MFRFLLLAAVIGATPLAASAQTAYSWGDSANGQLGNGSTTDNGTPTPVSAYATFLNLNVSAVANGDVHGLAIQNGVVYAWGDNSGGQLGHSSNAQDNLPMLVSSANGFTNTNVTAISGGQSYSTAIQSGVVYTWGSGSNGELGNGKSGQSTVPVLVADGTSGFVNSGVTAISAGTNFNLALQGGAVYAWGGNDYGQLGNGSTTARNVPVKVTGANGFTNAGVSLIATGQYAGFAVQSGSLYGWGLNNGGALGNGGTTSSKVPVIVSAANGFMNTAVTAVASGYAHTLAVEGGRVYAWGLGASGQLGNGGTSSSSVPVPINSVTLNNLTTIAVATGSMSSFALTSTGRLFDWGDNTYGQLGLGTVGGQFDTPQEVIAPNGYYWSGLGGGNEATSFLGLLSPLVVPEPGTWAMLGIGTPGAGVVALRRRRVAA